ncbi:hypothetical protein ACIQPT_31465 [Streptomyces sp. NPDC091289]|uniref:hypothetical protein n=1 Tax=Streptomyces sp. NPDC091289 TaxID=3365989 RepID=UPI0037FFD28D
MFGSGRARTHGYYLDVPFAETVIGSDSVLDGTVERIMLDTGLSGPPPTDR